MEVTCVTPDDTVVLGASLGRAARPGLTVLLQGPLGAGKTLFTKGIAQGLEIPSWRYVTSPTFAIHNQYQGRLVLHHLDLYRLGDDGELEGVGVEEFLYGPDICVIEWPDSFFDELPAGHLRVRISGDAGGAREVAFQATGDTAAAVLAEMAEQLGSEGG